MLVSCWCFEARHELSHCDGWVGVTQGGEACVRSSGRIDCCRFLIAMRRSEGMRVSARRKCRCRVKRLLIEVRERVKE